MCLRVKVQGMVTVNHATKVTKLSFLTCVGNYASFFHKDKRVRPHLTQESWLLRDGVERCLHA